MIEASQRRENDRIIFPSHVQISYIRTFSLQERGGYYFFHHMHLLLQHDPSQTMRLLSRSLMLHPTNIHRIPTPNTSSHTHTLKQPPLPPILAVPHC